MKPRFEITLQGYNDRLEMSVHGEIGLFEQLMIIDRLVHLFKYDRLMRAICGYMITRGGIAAILGRDYGTEYRYDVDAIKEMMEKFKKEGTQNDSN